MTTLESIRQKGEDLETLQHLASASLQSRANPTTPHPLLSSHPLNTQLETENLAAHLITHAQKTAKDLQNSLSHPPTPNFENPQSAFYTALRALRETHRLGISHRSSRNDLLADVPVLSFSGEEVGGKCLDLLQHHRTFINISGVDRIDYVTYLRQLPDFRKLSASTRASKPYEKYSRELYEYLEGFIRRAHPLEADILGDVLKTSRESVIQRVNEIAAKFPSHESILEEMGTDGVRDVLLNLGLKCGGRPEDRAKRLLTSSRKSQYGERAVFETAVEKLLQALTEELSATIDNVERKLAQSFQEVAADREEVQEESSEEEEIYNPKDIPLGWDGKPMPYWMYKLHGLNHVFKCEICGGASYRGPRAFERHFSESVHVAGLRRLGIGYSRAFLMVIGIQDAIRLQKKLESGQEVVEVEFEDAEGNVMNERTYRDLRRQGLI